MQLGRWVAVPFALACAGLPLVAPARDIGLVINGTAVVFDQPPVERDGRAFVPLRGLFERLGASVVFHAGHIALTAGMHRIGLHVGETAATIDGQAATLEAPPIVVGGRTLVPLRFIAQALGADVAYDGTTRIVSVGAGPLPATGPSAVVAATSTTPAVTSPSRAAATSRTPLAKGEIAIALRLLRVEPALRATLARRRPEISATFAESVDAASVRVAVDGADVTADTLVAARSFVTEPSSDLAAGSHTVTVTGRTPDKERFDESWTFSTTDAPNANYVNGLEPVSGTALGRTSFDVSGFTRPKARVRIVATTSASSAAFSDVSDGSSTVDVVASAGGYFEALLVLVDHGSGLIDVRVASTALDRSIAVRTLRLRL